MGKGKIYIDDFKDMIVDLYKSRMQIKNISKKYDIARSTLYR